MGGGDYYTQNMHLHMTLHVHVHVHVHVCLIGKKTRKLSVYCMPVWPVSCIVLIVEQLA